MKRIRENFVSLLAVAALLSGAPAALAESSAEKAPEAVTKKLEESLNTLKGLAEKAEPFTKEDLTTVSAVTGDVLGLL